MKGSVLTPLALITGSRTQGYFNAIVWKMRGQVIFPPSHCSSLTGSQPYKVICRLQWIESFHPAGERTANRSNPARMDIGSKQSGKLP